VCSEARKVLYKEIPLKKFRPEALECLAMEKEVIYHKLHPELFNSLRHRIIDDFSYEILSTVEECYNDELLDLMGSVREKLLHELRVTSRDQWIAAVKQQVRQKFLEDHTSYADVVRFQNNPHKSIREAVFDSYWSDLDKLYSNVRADCVYYTRWQTHFETKF